MILLFLRGKCNKGLIAMLDEAKNMRFSDNLSAFRVATENEFPSSASRCISCEYFSPHSWERTSCMKSWNFIKPVFFRRRATKKIAPLGESEKEKERKKKNNKKNFAYEFGEMTRRAFKMHACASRLHTRVYHAVSRLPGAVMGRERGREEGKKYVYSGNATV